MTEQNEAAVETKENTTEPSSPEVPVEELFGSIIDFADDITKEYDNYDIVGKICAKGTEGTAKQLSAAFNYIALIPYWGSIHTKTRAAMQKLKDGIEDQEAITDLDAFFLQAAQIAREAGKVIPVLAAEKKDAQYSDLWNVIRHTIAEDPGQRVLTVIYETAILKIEKAEPITEIYRQEYFALPIAKAWRMQQGIAQTDISVKMPQINVGQNTEKGEVFISASITDREGKPVNLDGLEKGVQRAIGNLIDEAAGNLPLNVTPQQIYRAYARLPSDATVTEKQEAQIVAAMDKLLDLPSSIDFKSQLESHKSIKQQKDYDYSDPQAGFVSGHLISGLKGGALLRDGKWNISYKIYDYPIFYSYSHIINQIAQVPNWLLTGGEKAPIKAEKTFGAQGTARNIAVKENILTRIIRMQECKKRKKSFSNLIRIEEVASDCGIELTPDIRRTLIKNIGLYLETLQQDKQLKKAAQVKEGRKIAGYRISI